MTQVGSTAWIVVGWCALAVAFASAGAMTWDIFARGHRQQMAIMDVVWPITALYWGPVAVWMYFRRDRRRAGGGDDPPGFWAFARTNWWPISKGVSHCGAGCTLGDIGGEWIVYLTAWSIGVFAAEDANTLMAMFVADFVLAWTLGIAFQYFSIVPVREDVNAGPARRSLGDLGRLEGIWAAVKADTLSIVAFQVGLFGYMALYHLVFWQPPLSVASPAYWFMMQIGMIVGFFTAWPVNAWLVRRGWKEKM